MNESYSWNPFGFSEQKTNLDLELLKKEVGQRFPCYDFKFNQKSAIFFCNVDKETLEEKFEELRKSLSEKGYIPMLKHQQGEQLIYVIEKPKTREKPIWINIALLILTIFTTILTGSILSMGYFGLGELSDPLVVLKPENLLNGALLFSLPLMTIIIVHEMGHYFVSKKHGISTSLPFFIPVPPVLGFNIGTFGALISSRDPMPNKKALFDIGLAGPLAGFIVAIPITAIGIVTAKTVPIVPLKELQPGEIIFGSSLLIDLMINLIRDLPSNITITMTGNPVLFAGWVGLLITSINLLPAGQLDGGHVFRAVFGDKQKYIGWMAVIIMIFTGWWLFAFIIIFLMGTSHPPPLNDDSDIDTKRKLLFIIAIMILASSFILNPIYVA